MKKLLGVLLSLLMLFGVGSVGASALTMEEPWVVTPDTSNVWNYDSFTAPQAGRYTFYTKAPVGPDMGLEIVDPVTNSIVASAHNTSVWLKSAPRNGQIPNNTGTVVLPFYLEEGQEVQVICWLPYASGEAIVAVRNYDKAVDFAGLAFLDKTITLLRGKQYSMEDCVSGVIPGTGMTIEYENNGVLAAADLHGFYAVPQKTGTCKISYYDTSGELLGQSAITVEKSSAPEWLDWLSQRTGLLFYGILESIQMFFIGVVVFFGILWYGVLDFFHR